MNIHAGLFPWKKRAAAPQQPLPHAAPIEAKRSVSRRTVLRRCAAGFAALTGLDAAVIEPNWIALETIEIPIRNLHPAFDGYRIALLSDLHYPRRMAPAFVRKAIRVASEFRPDLIAITGDITDRKGEGHVPDLSGLFDYAHPRDGMYGVLGSYDHWLDAPGVRREILSHTPIRLIENRCVRITHGGGMVAVGGVGDLLCGIVDLRRTFAGVPSNVPRILLSHNPDIAEEPATRVRIDLQLSGHTHGGEVMLPLYGPVFTPSRYGARFRSGLVQGKQHPVYITRGLCTPHLLRFRCRPEVTGIILRPTDSEQAHVGGSPADPTTDTSWPGLCTTRTDFSPA